MRNKYQFILTVITIFVCSKSEANTKILYAFPAPAIQYYIPLPIDPDSIIIGFSNCLLFHKLPEGLLGNFLTDAVKFEAEIQFKKRIDLVYLSPNAFRGTISKGNITNDMIEELLPFNDSLTIIDISGTMLKSFLNRIAIKGGGPVSGIHMRIQNMRAEEIIIGEDPINQEKIYRLLVIEKNALGEENFDILKLLPQQKLPFTLTYALIKYIKKMTRDGRPISAHFDQRIRYD